METSTFELHTRGKFTYVDERPVGDERATLVLLHGILGGVDNWKDNVGFFAERGFRVWVPSIPCYKLPMSETSVMGLADFVYKFVMEMGRPERLVMVGNSLGGQIALHYLDRHPDGADALVLAGSSGLRELAMRADFFRRKDMDFIRSRADMTFFDSKKHVSDYFLKDVKRVVNDRGYALRLIKLARSSAIDVVGDFLPKIAMPTLIVWGANDQLTPQDVAEDFQAGFPNSELYYLDECGHAPMMEHPEQFNELTLAFLDRQFG